MRAEFCIKNLIDHDKNEVTLLFRHDNCKMSSISSHGNEIL